MTFEFENGSTVEIPPVDGKNLKDAAWRGHRPNAVTVLGSPSPITLHKIPLATAQEILDAIDDVQPQTEPLRQLREQIEIEYLLQDSGDVAEDDASPRTSPQDEASG